MKNYLTFIVSLCIFSFTFSQTYEISGKITDKNNQPIYGANIILSESLGTVSDENGNYSIKVEKGNYTIKVSYLGFKSIKKSISVETSRVYNFTLVPKAESLNEVVITENIEALDTRDTQMSVNSLDAESIKNIPAAFGEVDVIRSLLQLPGVSNAGEGAAGFNVRGGNTDQNLILVDDAILFSSSHLFGFFSIFNPDAVDNLKLYKGGIPANFGGRVSSVLDINQKKANLDSISGNGGIGVISSKLLLELPIKKKKSSLLLAGRATYAHLFLKLTDNQNTAYFYDFNAKYFNQINQKNSIAFSVYHGNDLVSINESFTNTYGNTFGNFKWNSLLSENLSGDFNLSYSRYNYNLDLSLVGFEFDNWVSNLNLNANFNHFISDQFRFKYGLSSIKYTIEPGNIIPSSDNSGINPDNLANKHAFEHAAYFSVKQKLSDAINLEYGLRLNAFWRMGQGEIFSYENNQPIRYNNVTGIYEETEPIDTRQSSASKIEKEFYNLEPRFAISYSFNDHTSLKASYNRLAQNMHLLSNTSSPTPFDVWTPSGEFVKPQLLNQYSIGFFKNYQNKTYSFETEVFYKTVDNRIDYVNGANLIANDQIESVILNGESRAYGLELLARKNKGKLTGWIAYTISRSEQRTPGFSANDPGINNGDWYLANFDRLHDLSLTANYDFNKKWDFNASFTLQTGRPVNFPVGQFEYQGLNIPVYEGRNTNRLPAFHRLDISATLTPQNQDHKSWTSKWNFGIFNLYNRKNAASLNFEQNRTSGQNEAVRLSIFGIIPSVSYIFEF